MKTKISKTLFILLLPFISGGCGSGSDPVISHFHREEHVSSVPSPDPEGYLVTNSIYTHALGFKNVGNTCFANSVLKLLLAHPEVEQFAGRKLEQRSYETNEEYLVRENLRQSLESLLKKVAADSHSLSENKSVSKASSHYETELLTLFGEFNHLVASSYLGFAQQDGHEFAALLMEALDYGTFFRGFTSVPLLEFDSGPKRLSPSVVETWLSLPVLDSKNAPVFSLQRALDEYHSKERMEGDRRLVLKEGQPKEDGTRRLFMIEDSKGNAPEHILVQLKRFSFNKSAKKLEHPVDILSGMDLDLYPHDIKANELEPVSSTYRIPKKIKMLPRAVVVHHGASLNSGHYIAYVYDPQRRVWISHDDEEVKVHESRSARIAAKNDIQQNVYLILMVKDGTDDSKSRFGTP